MSALLELGARCEAAEGPDRELDCLIWCATAESHFEYHGGECVLAVQGGFSARLDWKDLPHPTSSIDAALTLKEGIGVLITLSEIKGDGMPHCVIGNPATAELFEAVAATPALAICAASLRARDASKDQADG